MKKTHIRTVPPWGLFPRTGHKLLCSDGKVRAARLAQSAETWFSVPASVRIKGKTITGYFTMEESGEAPFGSVCAFRHHSAHDGALPAWPDRFTQAHESLLKSAL